MKTRRQQLILFLSYGFCCGLVGILLLLLYILSPYSLPYYVYFFPAYLAVSCVGICLRYKYAPELFLGAGLGLMVWIISEIRPASLVTLPFGLLVSILAINGYPILQRGISTDCNQKSRRYSGMKLRSCLLLLVAIVLIALALGYCANRTDDPISYIPLSPWITILIVVLSVALLQRTSETPLSKQAILVITVLIFLASYVVMLPVTMALAWMLQDYYNQGYMLFIGFLIHVPSALIPPYAFYLIRRYRERKGNAASKA